MSEFRGSTLMPLSISLWNICVLSSWFWSIGKKRWFILARLGYRKFFIFKLNAVWNQSIISWKAKMIYQLFCMQCNEELCAAVWRWKGKILCSILTSHQSLFRLQSNDSKYIARVMYYSISFQALKTISVSYKAKIKLTDGCSFFS